MTASTVQYWEYPLHHKSKWNIGFSWHENICYGNMTRGPYYIRMHLTECLASWKFLPASDCYTSVISVQGLTVHVIQTSHHTKSSLFLWQKKMFIKRGHYQSHLFLRVTHLHLSIPHTNLKLFKAAIIWSCMDQDVEDQFSVCFSALFFMGSGLLQTAM
jgi:hypothetical protein